MALEGYISATSIAPGDKISFHVSSDVSAAVRIEIFEVRQPSLAPVFVDCADARHYDTPPRAYETGCGWPPFYTLEIPLHWPSALYRAVLSSDSPKARCEIFFVVRSAEPGSKSSTMLQFATTTYQAYNSWGGKSLYPWNSPLRSRKVSFDRPGGLDYSRETAFLLWMHKNGVSFECCSSVDLHQDPELLSHYQLLLSVGHDEYWSKEMRDNVEGFTSNGGNVAFFGGNTCWWQIRFEDGNRTMVCYRSALEDPLLGVDDSRVTVNWYQEPVNRPENYMTGVSFRSGAGIWRPCTSSMNLKAFTVRQAHHWVFDGTGLSDGCLFGVGEYVVGYETDAADYVMDAAGNLRLTGRDGTPPSFVVLATADLHDWGPCGKAGFATMGIFNRTGTVFTAATTDWARGLFNPNSVIPRITLNVIRRLGSRCSAHHWEVIEDRLNIVAICANQGRLFGATRSNSLVSREITGQRREWAPIGEANDIGTMSCGENSSSRGGYDIYAATRKGMLIRREAVADHSSTWQAFGALPEATGLAYANNYLYCANHDGKIFRRVLENASEWEPFGSLDKLVTMCSSDLEVFAVTNDNTLWWAELFGSGHIYDESTWKPIGEVPSGIVSLAALDGKLFAIAKDNLLWRTVASR
jgi:hypothetical protein